MRRKLSRYDPGKTEDQRRIGETFMSKAALENHSGLTRRDGRGAAAFTRIGLCVASLAVLLGLQDTATAQSRQANSGMPPPIDRQREIALALSACPSALASGAAVYVLDKTGYVKVRDSENGFTALIQHSTPAMNEPQCLDREGSSTYLQRYLKVAEWRSQRRTPQEIRKLLADALARGELTPPSRPGVIYMLSSINTVVDAKGGVAPFPPHVMFFGTKLTNADLGVGKEVGPDGQPVAPAFVVGEGTPYALVIVPPGSHAGKSHAMADVAPGATQ
jgi:hypothetical protein